MAYHAIEKPGRRQENTRPPLHGRRLSMCRCQLDQSNAMSKRVGHGRAYANHPQRENPRPFGAGVRWSFVLIMTSLRSISV